MNAIAMIAPGTLSMEFRNPLSAPFVPVARSTMFTKPSLFVMIDPGDLVENVSLVRASAPNTLE
jgi:hypothetical protein